MAAGSWQPVEVLRCFSTVVPNAQHAVTVKANRALRPLYSILDQDMEGVATEEREKRLDVVSVCT